MRVLGRALAAVIVLVLLVLSVLYAAFPWVIRQALIAVAEANDFTIYEVSVSRPGLAGLQVQSFHLASPQLNLNLRDGLIRYSWSGLLHGRFDAIAADRVHLIVEDAPADAETDAELSPALLFPALPVDTIAIQTLRVEVRALDFVGEGTANWGEQSLLLTMNGIQPEVASRFGMAATLSADGQFDLQARQTGTGGGEIVIAAGELVDERLAVAGQIDLRGYALDLVAALAGLPDGDGHIAGQFDLRAPWPLPDALDWRDVRLDARDGEVAWAQSDGSIALNLSDAELALRESMVSLETGGTLSVVWDGGHGQIDLPSGYRVVYGDDLLKGGSGPRLSAHTSDVDTALALQRFQLGAGGSLQAAAEVLELSPSGQLPSGYVKGAQVELKYELDSGAGGLVVDHQLTVKKALLASSFPDWSQEYDIDRGTIDVAVEASWRTPDVVPLTVRYELQEVGGFYEDYRIRKVSGAGTLSTLAVGDAAWRLAPADINIGEIDVGFPVTEVQLAISGTLPVLQVNSVSARALGGQARASAFDYDLEAGNADIELQVEGVDLTAVLALEGEDVTGSGNINGRFPVRVRNHEISMQGGLAQSVAPGGTIQLAPALAQPTGQPGLDFALTALQDFRFTDLSAAVDYAENGDLRLGVKLKGNNPAVERGRAIEYNLNISENLPVLLESLRMQDEVRKRVERQLNQ